MSTKITRRKLLALAAQATTVACASRFFVVESAGMNQSVGANAKYKDVFEALDEAFS